MSRYLLASTPLGGHVAPLIAVGRHLVAQGHQVTLISGSRFERAATAAGLQLIALHGSADYDEHDLSTYLPDADRHRGVGLSQYQVQQTFIRPIPDQWRTLREALESDPPDAVVVDCMFAGVLPLLLRPRTERPPVVALGISPLPQRSRNTAPYNMALRPSWSGPGILRNRLLNTVAARLLFAPTQRLAERLVAEAAGQPLPADFPFVLDLSRVFDRFLQLGPAEFEYPLSDLAPQVRFVGPVETSGSWDTPLPVWWRELNDGRPIVHVTQGTLANASFDTLIRPAVDGLADLDAHVVVSTGGAPVDALGTMPANVRAAEFLPYDILLPRTDVLVTNGGFGTTLLALADGVPLVVAPGAEDKPEVAARVDFFEVGVNLRTGSPTPDAVATAVRRVLHDDGFSARARAMALAIARYDALGAIEEELTRMAAPAPR